MMKKNQSDGLTETNQSINQTNKQTSVWVVHKQIEHSSLRKDHGIVDELIDELWSTTSKA